MRNPIANMGDRVGANRIKPGETRNPGGRPSLAKALKAHGLTTTATLEQVVGVLLKMLRSKNARERMFAVEQWTERLLGKTTTPIRVSGVVTNLDPVALAGMSDDELRRQLAEAEAEAEIDDEDSEEDDDDGEAASGDAQS